MKKLLLPFAFAALTAFAGQALSTGYTSVWRGTLTANATVTEYAVNNDVTLIYGQGTGTEAPHYDNPGLNVIINQGNTLTVSAASGYTITKVALVGYGAGGCLSADNATVDKGALSAPNSYGDEASWTGDARTFTITAGANVSLTAVTVTYEEGGEEKPVEPDTVENPVLTLVEDEYCFTMTMSCPTEGAKIYYTEDGSEPSAESTLYTAPVDVWMATTFKAVAVNGTAVSDVVTYEANPPFMLEGFAPLLDFDGDAEVLIKGQMTVVYKNGSYVYVKDASGCYMLVYGKNTPDFVNGDQFDRLEGTFTHYADQPEITNPVFGEFTTGEAVAPALVDLEALGANMMCHYVQVEGVQLTGVSGKNATFKLGEVELAAYNTFNVENFENALECTVTGFVGINNGTIRLIPTEIVITKEEEPEPQPAGVEVVLFKNQDWSSGVADAYSATDKTRDWVAESGVVFTTSIEVSGFTYAKIYTNDLRIYGSAGNKITVNAPSNKYFTKVVFTVDGKNSTGTPLVDDEETTAVEDSTVGNYSDYEYVFPAADKVTSYTLSSSAKSGNLRVSTVAMSIEDIDTSVGNIEVDANAPVEYFNLQGVRVENPANGLYIRRQGNTVTKVVL